MKIPFFNTSLTSKTYLDNTVFEKNRTPYIEDVYRSLFGSFYYIQDREIKKPKLLENADLELISVNTSSNEETYFVKFNKNSFSKELKYDNNMEYPTKEYSVNIVKDYLNNVRLNYRYYDYYFSFQQYVNESNMINEKVGSYYKLNSFYNFNSPIYDSIGSQLNSLEYVLPNIYDVLNLKSENIETRNKSLRNLSFDGLIPKEMFSEILLRTNTDESSNDYFEEYGKTFNTSDGLKRLQVNVNTSLLVPNVIFDEETISKYDRLMGNFLPFPYYTYIEVSNNFKDNEIIKLLKEYEIYNDLMLFYYDNVDSNLFESSTTAMTEVESRVSSSEKNIKSINMKTWIMNNVNASADTDNFGKTSYTKKIKYSLFLEGLLEKFKITSKKRTYKELLEGVESKSYPLFFKITKHPLGSKSKAIQTYILPSTESDITKFFDTQVKYNKEYFYKISICTLVIGNEYTYKEYYTDLLEKARDIESSVMKMKVQNESSLQILEIPVAEIKTVIIQPPNMVPNIDIQSYKQLSDKLKINVLGNSADHTEEYQIVEEQDFDIFDKVSIFQRINDKNIFFSGKIDGKKLQVYKSLKKPKVYSDFSGLLSKTINIDENFSNFEDDIIPNITYYYMFRVLNEHNVPSNPSKVFKITLKDEDGMIYLNKEIIDLEKVLIENPFKSFKRYLQIIPTINQTIIGNDMEELKKYVDNYNDTKSVILGSVPHQVWNKKFKVRLRSKNSGKVLEFYFKFKYDK